MSEQKYITLKDGREVPAEDYIMAYAPLSLIRKICEPLGTDRPSPPVSRPQSETPREK